MEERPRVLTILPDFPFPESTGLHLRMAGNLDLLARLGCESHVAYFSTRGRPHNPLDPRIVRLSETVVHLGARREQDEFSRRSLIRHKIGFMLAGLFPVHAHRYPFSMRYDAIGGEGLVARRAREVDADFVVIPSFCLHYAATLASEGRRTIVDAADVLSDLTKGFFRTQPGSPAHRVSLYANYLASRMQERVFIPECEEIWSSSMAEAEVFRSIRGAFNVVVVPNTIDESRTVISPRPDARTFGFIGTYSYGPNLNAATFLVEEVLPLVRAEVPVARLIIAGANLPESARERFSRTPGVDLMGKVEDSSELYDKCDVLALPVFVRGGVPLKLIESLARMRPVVATPELVDGLDLVDGRDLLIRDSALAFASGIVDLFRDPALAERIASQGHQRFAENWSRRRAEQLLRNGSTLMGNPARSRVVAVGK